MHATYAGILSAKVVRGKAQAHAARLLFITCYRGDAHTHTYEASETRQNAGFWWEMRYVCVVDSKGACLAARIACIRYAAILLAFYNDIRKVLDHERVPFAVNNTRHSIWRSCVAFAFTCRSVFMRPKRDKH